MGYKHTFAVWPTTLGGLMMPDPKEARKAPAAIHIRTRYSSMASCMHTLGPLLFSTRKPHTLNLELEMAWARCGEFSDIRGTTTNEQGTKKRRARELSA